VAARCLQAITLVAAPLAIERGTSDDWPIVAIYTLVVTALIAAVFSEQFPDCYLEGKGLIVFKIISEYVISVSLLAVVYSLSHLYDYFRTVLYRVYLSKPVLLKIEGLLVQHLHAVTPNSLLGKSLHYLSSQ